MKDMPSVQAVMKWLNNDENFYRQYQTARENQGDLYGEMINDIAIELLTGQRTDFQNCRVAIDALKWTVSKMNSKWSDRQVLDVNQTNYVDELSKVQDTIKQRIEEKNKEKSRTNVVAIGDKVGKTS
jgi:predicted transcriptional regulator